MVGTFEFLKLYIMLYKLFFFLSFFFFVISVREFCLFINVFRWIMLQSEAGVVFQVKVRLIQQEMLLWQRWKVTIKWDEKMEDKRETIKRYTIIANSTVRIIGKHFCWFKKKRHFIAYEQFIIYINLYINLY